MAEEEIANEKGYIIKSVKNLSSRPILSLGTYLSLDAECVIAGSSDKNIRFVDIDTLDEIAKCAVDKKSVSFVAISEMSPEGDDPIIVTGGKDSSVQIWNPYIEGNLEKSIQLPTNEVRSLAVYQGSVSYLMVGTKDSLVIVWDIKDDKIVATFKGHKASVHCVSITSSVIDFETQNDLEYMCLASGGADRTVRTWSIATGKKLKKFRHKRSIAAMVVAHSGIRPILASGGVEREIKLWDVETGVLLRNIGGHLDQINSLCLWEGYQTLLVSGSADHTIRVFDILTGECVCVLLGHKDSVLNVTIANREAPKIVSSGDDLALIQWDLQKIIDEFFLPGEGERNLEVAPYVPKITYTAPAELDREVLSKDERKRIRKEMKKEKRKKQMHILGSVSEATSSSRQDTARGSIDSSFAFLDTDDLDDDEEDEDEEELGMLSPTYHEDAAAAAEAAKQAASAKLDELECDAGAKAPPYPASPSPVPDLNAMIQNQQQKQQHQPLSPAKSGGNLSTSSSQRKIIPGETVAGDVVVKQRSLKSLLRKASSAVLFVIGASHSAAKLATAAEGESETAQRSPQPQLEQKVSATAGGAALHRRDEQQQPSIRAQAGAVHSKYNSALVERQLEEDRLKMKASEKLAMRLNRKKKLTGADTAGAATETIEEQSEEKRDASTLEAEKAAKLRQHKMQEKRRMKSMILAKDRSSRALRQRLDELAAKRKQAAQPSGGTRGGSGGQDGGKDGGTGCGADGALLGTLGEEGEDYSDSDDSDDVINNNNSSVGDVGNGSATGSAENKKKNRRSSSKAEGSSKRRTHRRSSRGDAAPQSPETAPPALTEGEGEGVGSLVDIEREDSGGQRNNTTAEEEENAETVNSVLAAAAAAAAAAGIEYEPHES